MPRPREWEMIGSAEAESSGAIRGRVCAARKRQLARQEKPNAWLQPGDTVHHCTPDESAARLLAQAIVKLSLSARACHRVLRVARTIADLAGDAAIGAAHLAEAIQYRRLDGSL